jgi:phosphate transporter
MTMVLALSKLNITDRLSVFVFKKLPNNPRLMLLALMVLNVVTSSFLSSASASTLMLAFTLPIIRRLDPDDPFVKALLFGLGWSGNCGNMPSWIASPQNLMALNEFLSLSNAADNKLNFIRWLGFGFPVSLVLCLLEWVYLCWMYPPRRHFVSVAGYSTEFRPWVLRHTYTCLITVATIVLWSIQQQFDDVLGDIGITSLVPVIAFFGSEMLTVEDFQTLRWSTLSLMGGGLALGEAMRQSRLLDLLRDTLGDTLGQLPPYWLLVIILVVVALAASLMNSIAAAAILFPIIGLIGQQQGRPGLYLSCSALMVSGGQLFHMSTFANSLVYGVCRHVAGSPDRLTTEPFLEKRDFPVVGWPTLLFGVLVIASVGYGIITRINIDRPPDQPS